jgi:hypothetical protein
VRPLSSMDNPITSIVWLSRQKSRVRIPREDRQAATYSITQRGLTVSQSLKSAERFRCLLPALQKRPSRQTTDEHE